MLFPIEIFTYVKLEDKDVALMADRVRFARGYPDNAPISAEDILQEARALGLVDCPANAQACDRHFYPDELERLRKNG